MEVIFCASNQFNINKLNSAINEDNYEDFDMYENVYYHKLTDRKIYNIDELKQMLLEEINDNFENFIENITIDLISSPTITKETYICLLRELCSAVIQFNSPIYIRILIKH